MLISRCKLVIDWHNFGYSILALSQGKNSHLVKIAYWYDFAIIYYLLLQIFAFLYFAQNEGYEPLNCIYIIIIIIIIIFFFSVNISEYCRYERCFGRGAHANFCVTRAMKSELSKRWSVNARVLYDRAPDLFRPITAAEERHELFKKLKAQSVFGSSSPDEEDTLFTCKSLSTGQVSIKRDRPALVSTSQLFEKCIIFNF
jgi:beta-1,4-mannosyltransferase